MNKIFRSRLFSFAVLIISFQQIITSQVKPPRSSRLSDEAAIKHTATSFLQAANKRDRRALYALSAKTSVVELPSGKMRIEDWNHLEQLVTDRPRFSRVTIRGPRASLRTIVQFADDADDQNISLLPVSFDFDFQKIGSVWKVYSVNPSSYLFVRDLISAKTASEEQVITEKEVGLLTTEGLDVVRYFLSQTNNDEDASPSFTRLLDTIISSKDPRIIANVFWYYGDNFVRHKDFQRAYSFYQSGLQWALDSGDTFTKGLNLTGLAEVYVHLGELSKAEKSLSEAINIFSNNPGLKNHASWAYSRVGDAYFHTEDYTAALRLYEQAYELAASQNDKSRKAQTLNNMGACYWHLKNFSDAESSYRKRLAIVLQEEQNPQTSFRFLKGNPVWEAYYVIGLTHQEQGQPKSAVEFYRKAINAALEYRSAKGLETSSESLAQLYVSRNDIPRALQTYNELLEKLLIWRDGPKLAQSLIDAFSELAYDSDQRSEASGLWAKWLQKGAVLFSDKDVVNLSFAKGFFELRNGNPKQSEISFQKIIEAPNSSPSDKFGASVALADVYLSQGQRNEALKRFDQAEIWGEQRTDWERLKKVIQMAKIPLLIPGNGMDKVESIRALKEIENQNKGNKTLVGISVLFQGIVYLSSFDEEKLDEHQDDFKKAVSTLEASLTYLDDPVYESKQFAMVAHMYLACAFWISKDHYRALIYTGKAKSIAVQLHSTIALNSLNALEGFIYADMKQWKDARGPLESALAEFEKNAANVTGGVLGRLETVVSNHSAYQAMIRSLLGLHETENALIYAERSKARMLLEFNDTRTNRPSEKIAPFVSASTYGAPLRKENISFSNYGNLLSNRQDSGSSKPSTPLVTKDSNSPVVTGTQLRALLPDPKAALLQFFVDEKEIYLFVLTANSGGTTTDWRNKLEWEVFRIEKSKSLEGDVEKLQDLISDNRTGYSNYCEIVYDSLLRPAEKLISGKSTLIIIPDGFLWSIPFQALKAKPDRFLIEDHVIYYAPSLSVLSRMQEIRAGRQQKLLNKFSKDILSIGYPTQNEQTIAQKPVVFRGVRGMASEVSVSRNPIRLGPIPFAAKEAKALVSIYGPGRVNLRVSPVETTKERFINEAWKYRVLHIATHGILDGNYPMDSALLFGANPAKVPAYKSKKSNAANVEPVDGVNIFAENQLLRAEEIMKMKLSADLVVLSACNTASGEVNEGEGLIGLSWAFLAAGVPTIVSSQWAVSDQSTEILMTDFHRRLQLEEKNSENPRNVAEKLRNASIFLMNQNEQYRHPYYWAAFITIGSNR